MPARQDGAGRPGRGPTAPRMNGTWSRHASEKIEDSSIDDVRLSNSERLEIQARFRNLDDMHLDDFCGRVVTIVANDSKGDGATVIREVTDVRP
jgi:hypothetical protein